MRTDMISRLPKAHGTECKTENSENGVGPLPSDETNGEMRFFSRLGFVDVESFHSFPPPHR